MLQAMYREWPFFQMLLSNMDMVLAKSDIAIASRYADLVADTTLRNRIFSRIACGMAERDRRAADHHGPEAACSKATRCWRARSATAFPISIRSTTCRSSC